MGNHLEGEESLKRKREAVELLQDVVESLQDVVSYQPDDLSRYRLASALGSLAFYLVLDSQFAEAQARCEEAQSLANKIGDGVQKSDRDNLVFIQQNLAHALLLHIGSNGISILHRHRAGLLSFTWSGNAPSRYRVPVREARFSWRS